MHILTWILAAILVGVNLHSLVALGAALTGHPAAASRQRAWALRCAVSGYWRLGGGEVPDFK